MIIQVFLYQVFVLITVLLSLNRIQYFLRLTVCRSAAPLAALGAHDLRCRRQLQRRVRLSSITVASDSSQQVTAQSPDRVRAKLSAQPLAIFFPPDWGRNDAYVSSRTRWFSSIAPT